MNHNSCAILGLTVVTSCVSFSHAVVYMSEGTAQAGFFPGLLMTAHIQALSGSQLAMIRSRIGPSVPINPLLRYWQGPGGERMYVDAVIGKHDWIRYALGIDAAGHVCGMEILEYREAYGSEIRAPGWRKQFIGYPVQDAESISQKISIISGATLSSRHVTEGIERLLVTHELLRP